MFVWRQLQYCDSLFQNRQWHTHIEDLFVDSLWRELRLRTTVFAGVANVAQRAMRLPFCCTFRMFLRHFFQSTFPENSDWFSFRSQLIFVPLFGLSVNHLGVVQHGETQAAPICTVNRLCLGRVELSCPLTSSRASSTSGTVSSAAYPFCVELLTLSYHILSQARRLEICNIEPGDCAAVCSRSGIGMFWTLLRDRSS